MLGIGKKRISADEAVQGYITHVVEIADATFKEWLQSMIQMMTALGVSSDTMKTIINSRDVKTVYFTALLALGAIAIENCFDKQTTNVLMGKFDAQLQTIMGEEKEWIADVVFDYLECVKVQLETRTALPNDTIAFRIMEHLRFDEHEETKKIIDMPPMAMSISIPLAVAGTVGWWSSLAKEFRIKV